MIYNTLKFMHIVAACIGVGSTFTYAMWFSLARRQSDRMGIVLQGVKLLDGWVAKPAFIIAGLSGALLVYASGMAWATLWVWLSLMFYAVSTLIATRIAGPLLDRQMALYAGKGAEDPEFQAVAMRSKRLGPVLGLMTMAILYLMVFKPI